MNDDNFQEDFEKVFSIVEGERKLADETQIPLPKPKPKPGKMEKLSRQDSKVKKYEMAAEPRHQGGSKTKVKKYQVAANPPCLPGSAHWWARTANMGFVTVLYHQVYANG